MFFKVRPGDPEWPQKIKASAGPWSKGCFGSALTSFTLFLGHNLSLGLRAETEDSGLSAELRSVVAPSKWASGFCF